MNEIPLPPGPPEWLKSNAPKKQDEDVRAFTEVKALIGRCECLRCGNVWYTMKKEKPKQCSECHSSYWDTPAKWNRKTKEEKAKEKTEKAARKAALQGEFEARLEVEFNKLVKEFSDEGKKVDTRKASKKLTELTKKVSNEETGGSATDKNSNEPEMEVLGTEGGVSYNEIPEDATLGIEETLPADAPRDDGASLPSWVKT
jgi:transketolase